MVPINAKGMTVRSAATLIAIAALTGCAAFDEGANVLAGDVHTNPLACSRQLVGSNRPQHSELDSGDIRFVNWNIQKGGDPQWTTDLATFQGDPDLMVLQEVPLNPTDLPPRPGRTGERGGLARARGPTPAAGLLILDIFD